MWPHTDNIFQYQSKSVDTDTVTQWDQKENVQCTINTCIKEVRFFYFCFKKLNIKEYDGCSSNTSPDQYIHVSTKTDYFYFYLKKLNMKEYNGCSPIQHLTNTYRLLHGIFRIIPFISPRSWYQPEIG